MTQALSTPAPKSPQEPAPPPSQSRLRAFLSRAPVVFWLMFAINAVNYLDRMLAVAFGPTHKAEFQLHDREIGLLSSAFLLVYTLSTVPLGLLADRVRRARVVAVGVAVWSLASGASAFVRTFPQLFATRAAVGIGEASYYPAGTALLSRYFPLRERARVMGRWGAGQLVGIALAFGLAALMTIWLAPSVAWRVAFFCAAVPGLALAILIWHVNDAPAGKVEETSIYAHAAPPIGAHEGAFSDAWARIRTVLSIRTIWLIIALQAMMFITATPAITFLPIYVRSKHGPFHLHEGATALIVGLIIIVGGFSGQVLGGNLADWLSLRVRGGRVLVASIGYGLALPFFILMLLTHSLPLFLITGAIAVFAITLPAGPLTAAAQDATPDTLRATAVAVTLLLSHLLGDVWAPSAVGSIATALHEREGMALLTVGVPTLAIAAVLGYVGSRIYAREVQAAPAPTKPDARV